MRRGGASSVIRSCHSASPPPIESLTEDETAMQDMVRRFAREQIGPLVKEMDEQGGMPDSLVRSIFDHGLMGLEIHQDHGGVGASFTSTCLVIEEMSKVDMGSSLLVDVHNTVVAGLIEKLGNKLQKEKYLPRLATEWVGCFCLSEETSGSDAFALKTRAVQDGEDWILNGTKMWISAAPIGSLYIVLANANPGEKHRGISCFLVERDFPGVSIGPKENKMGIRTSETATVILEDVRVPAENVLGELGMGYKYAITMLNEGRVGIGAQLVGVAQGCLDHTIPYLLQRKQFGQPIYNFQGMQHQVAIAQTRVQAARSMVYDTARRIQAGLPFTKEAAMAKYYASEVACYTTSKCIEWMGGVGVTKDYPIEKYYRDCIVGTIYEGSSNMQLNTIARQIAQEYMNKAN